MEFQGTIYQFTSLPFRISTAPWLFTRVAGVVKELFHKNGLSLFQYLDDWLGDAQSKSQAQARCDLLVRLRTHLGFLINFEKLELIPTQVFDFVGIHFVLRLGKAYITVKNHNKVLSAVEHMIQRDQAPSRKWQALIGTLQAQATLISLGRMKIRPIQFHLTNRWNQNRDPLITPIPMSNLIRTLLWWWQNPENLKQGIPLEPPPFTHHLFTDAS